MIVWAQAVNMESRIQRQLSPGILEYFISRLDEPNKKMADRKLLETGSKLTPKMVYYAGFLNKEEQMRGRIFLPFVRIYFYLCWRLFHLEITYYSTYLSTRHLYTLFLLHLLLELSTCTYRNDAKLLK